MKSRLLVLTWIVLSVCAPSSARAESTPCGCYCGIWLPAPCSDQACKDACGWQDPAAPAAQETVSSAGETYAEPTWQEKLAAEKAAKDEEARRLAEEKKENERRFLQTSQVATRFLKGISGDTSLKGISNDAPTGGLKSIPPPDPAVPDRIQDKLKRAIENWQEEFQAGRVPAQNPAASDGAVRAYADNGDPRYPRIDEIERSAGREAWLRGMDAAMKHDWQLALAWFQTAQQKDPSNKALARAVDLAQWTWKKHSEPPKDPALQLPKDEDLELLFTERQAGWPGAVNLPQDKDIEFLFPQTQPEPSALQKPKDEDAQYLFPQTSPSK